MVIKTCQISCEYFWGFNKKLDIDVYNTKEKIIENVINSLKEKLIENNLILLSEKLEKIKNSYHIHDDLNYTNHDTIYICSCL